MARKIIDNQTLAVQAYDSLKVRFQRDKAPSSHGVQINLDVTTTAITVGFEISIDGVNFTEAYEKIATAGELTANLIAFSVVNTVASFVRLSVKSYTGGTSITAYYARSA